LWWANKELQREDKLSKYIGTNEKTKIVAKLQRKGSGPPVRDYVVNEKDQKDMMAFYYKKSQEQKVQIEYYFWHTQDTFFICYHVSVE
jgi:hypothetical protein